MQWYQLPAAGIGIVLGTSVLAGEGDRSRDDVIDELVGHGAHIVFGNCDFDVDGLRRHAEAMEVQVDHPLGRLEVGGRVIAFTHGDRPRLMDGAIDDGVDYLLHGHTHEIRDDRQGRTRVINPGALFRAARYTAALLDPGRDRLEILEIRPTAR